MLMNPCVLDNHMMFVFAFPERHRTVLSLISCFAGGVFLAACLLDIIPDYLSDINTELDARGVEVRPRMNLLEGAPGLRKDLPYIQSVHVCNAGWSAVTPNLSCLLCRGNICFTES